MSDIGTRISARWWVGLAAVSLAALSANALATEEVTASETMVEQQEMVTLPTEDPMTAIEVIIGKRIAASVLEGDRPHHVYRPRTPIYHHHHPENEPEPPVILRHLLVDHPELNNNQGRVIRTPPKEESSSDN